jgi:hypothetical protein
VADSPLVEVKVDEIKLANIRRMLVEIPNAMPTVISRGINRTATSARAELNRRLFKHLNLPKKRIGQNIKLYKALSTRWQATIDIFTRAVPLIHYGARTLKGKGVSYAILRGGGRKKIITPPTSAFIQTMPSGHVGVFRRRPGGPIAVSKLGSRYIYELKGPSVGAAFEGAPGMAVQVQWWAAAKLEKNIDDQVAFILNKWRSAAKAAG